MESLLIARDKPILNKAAAVKKGRDSETRKSKVEIMTDFIKKMMIYQFV